MADDLTPIEVAGLRVVPEPRLLVASLRYFDRNGVFAELLQSVAGMSLPDTLCALRSAGGPATEAIILAWRSPTETLMIAAAPTVIETLQVAATDMTDGCIVDQRGGAWVLRTSGERVDDLFARVGNHGACPAIGESRRSRLAGVPVLAVKVQSDETLLIVERTYGPHFMGAVRATAADLGIPLFS